MRTLGLAGIRSVVVAPPGDFTRYSRSPAGRSTASTPRRTRADRRADAGLGRGRPEKPVLSTTATGTACGLALPRATERGLRFVIPDEKLVEDCSTRRASSGLRRSTTCRCPRRTLDAGAGRRPRAAIPARRQAAHQAARQVEAARADQGASSATRAGARGARPRLDAVGVEVLVQELVPGPETLIESYHAYVDERARSPASSRGGRSARTRRSTATARHSRSRTHPTCRARPRRAAPDRLPRRREARLQASARTTDAPSARDQPALQPLAPPGRQGRREHPGARLPRPGRAAPPPAAPGAPRRRWCSPWRDFQAVRAQDVSLGAGSRGCCPARRSARSPGTTRFRSPGAHRYRALEKLRDRTLGSGGRRADDGASCATPSSPISTATCTRSSGAGRAQRVGVDGYLVAGDLVGYGPYPNECVERVAELGAVCVAGNHDLIALGSSRTRLHPARADLAWTGRARCFATRRAPTSRAAPHGRRRAGSWSRTDRWTTRPSTRGARAGRHAARAARSGSIPTRGSWSSATPTAHGL